MPTVLYLAFLGLPIVVLIASFLPGMKRDR